MTKQLFNGNDLTCENLKQMILDFDKNLPNDLYNTTLIILDKMKKGYNGFDKDIDFLLDCINRLETKGKEINLFAVECCIMVGKWEFGKYEDFYTDGEYK